jgi:hypothetical protein
MTVYRCTNCRHLLAPGESPCSKCGDARRTVDKLVETTVGSSVIVQMTIAKVRKEVQKNRPLLLFSLSATQFPQSRPTC